MAKREKEVVEGRGVGREEQDFLLRESSFPSPLSSVQIFNGFGILHPPSTVLYRARLRDDFARFYICMYVYVYIFVGVQASFYRCPFFDNRFIVKVAPRSIHRIGWKVLSVSQFRYSEFFFLEMKVFEDLYSSDRWSQKFVFS